MAKTAKVKKRQVTVHSRAARRAVSPSIDLGKDLKQRTTRDSTSPSRPSQAKPHALAAKNAGIQKKARKVAMTRAQRLRYEKGLERGAETLDKRMVKVVKSLDKEKVIKERSKEWEDVNGEKKKKKGNPFAGLDDDEEEQKQEREWVSDEEMDVEAAAAKDGSKRGNTEVQGESKQVEGIVDEGAVPAVMDDELL